jgi:cysteine desulfurase
MSFVIYLDHNATTPVLPEVLEAMMPYLATEWGSRRAERRSAWASAARPYRKDPACGTESNNAAIAAALKPNPGKRHFVTSQLEQSSVLNCRIALEKQSQDSPQSTPRSQGTVHQSASLFSVLQYGKFLFFW